LFVDATVVINFSVVADATQQTVDNAWRTARATRNLARTFVIDLDTENFRRTFADDFEIFVWIEVEMEDDTEASAQRGGYQTSARRCSDQSELWEFEFNRACTSALADQQIELIVLHRRVELFFECR